jgi:large subunit ribosomal protein L18
MEKDLRKRQVRRKILAKRNRPRLSVFRSGKFISAQIIDDVKGRTLIAVSERHLAGGEKVKKTKTEKAREVGRLLAKQAASKKITKIVFDRGPYQYHGRVKALAEGAREGGLIF